MTEQNQENLGQAQGQYYQGQPQGQYTQPGMQGGTPPNNYMTMSIVAIVVGVLSICGNCCISLIVAIVAIVFSSQVNNKFMMGDVFGAENSAKTAKILGIISLVVSGLTILGNIIFLLMGGMDKYMEIMEQIQSNYN